jgi:hypothetical protein
MSSNTAKLLNTGATGKTVLPAVSASCNVKPPVPSTASSLSISGQKLSRQEANKITTNTNAANIPNVFLSLFISLSLKKIFSSFFTFLSSLFNLLS